jgi:hypothetical protein
MATEPAARPGEEPSSRLATRPPALQWSKWFRCETSFSLLLVPEQPGVYAVAEEILAPGESAAARGKRELTLIQFAKAENLARALSRLFTPASPLYQRIAAGGCFLRYAVVEDEATRQTVCATLQAWLAASAEVLTPTAGTEHRLDKGELQPPPLPAGF